MATCDQCRHGVMAEGAAAANEPQPLYCRRYPPTVFLVMIPPRIQGQAPGINFATSFPIMQPDHYCGEYVSKAMLS